MNFTWPIVHRPPRSDVFTQINTSFLIGLGLHRCHSRPIKRFYFSGGKFMLEMLREW